MVAQVQKIQDLEDHLVSVQVDQANGANSIAPSLHNLIPSTITTSRTALSRESMMARMQQLTRRKKLGQTTL